MVSSVVTFFGKQFSSPFTERFNHIYSAALRPLLDFLLLSERFYFAVPPPHSGVIAPRILTSDTGREAFGQTILPALTSALLPTHPLQSLRLALKLFQRPEFR